MNPLQPIAAALITVACSLCVTPVARAETAVTYEVSSAYIGSANIQYFDGTRRQSLLNVPLPWRATVMVANPASVGFDTAEIRADWRWAAAPNRWVTARIYFGDALRCENSLDVGHAACYGTTDFKNV